ncbi:MAG TPA: glycosyltransferase [Methylomirabilota bacterium]|jgi:glycosyltransferase involved in cell wall biosynthesis|nr:glycosyltransferase [Methylomirabilota bacterium]
MPRVSVVVPAFNAERTIRATLLSVLAQTFTDFEMIVVDDGSHDRTVEIVGEITDPRLRVVSFPNGGTGMARNRGIALARGELVAFIDADDLWTPDKLEAQVAALARHPEAGASHSWTVFVDEAGRERSRQQPVFFEGDVCRGLLVENFTCSGSNILVRRAALETVGGFDPSLTVSEDWEFCVRLAAQWPFVLVPRYQILYRQMPASKSSNPRRWEEHARRAIERTFAHVPARLQPLKRRRMARYHLQCAHRWTVAVEDRDLRAAGRALARAVRHEPGLVLDRTFQRVVARWLLTGLSGSARGREHP